MKYQIQANILPSTLSLHRPTTGTGTHEMTALGAAIAAGLGAGIYSGLDEVERVLGASDGDGDGTGNGGGDGGKVRFQTEIDQDTAREMWERWERAVEMGRGWVR